MTLPLYIRPISRASYDILSVHIIERGHGFEIFGRDSDTDLVFRHDVPPFENLADAKDHAKALLLDYVHRHKSKPFTGTSDSVVINWIDNS